MENLSPKNASVTRLHFIRHGETDNNKTGRIQGRGVDAPLNDLGRSQARQVAEVLDQFPIDVIVTSSLRRTYETAKPLIERRSFVLESYADLDEMDFGRFEGKRYEEFVPDLKDLQQHWNRGETDKAIPEGESPNDVFERSSKVVRDVIARHRKNHIAFFIHGRLSRILLSGLLGLGLHRMQEIEHCNGSINVVDVENDTFTARVLHFTDHLLTLNRIHT